MESQVKGKREAVSQSAQHMRNAGSLEGITSRPSPSAYSQQRAVDMLPVCLSQGSKFSVIVTEGRPDSTGISMARLLEKAGVPVTIVLDSAAAYVMDRVDMVLLGAEGWVANCSLQLLWGFVS